MAAGCGLRAVFVLLVLVICCVIPQSVEAKSFANLVKTVSLGRGTTNSSNPKYIYETGPECVAFTSSSSQKPYIDVGLVATSRVRTVLIYLPITGTDYRNIQLSFGSTTHSFKKHTDIDQNIVAIWEGDHSTYTLRIRSNESSFTLCLIKVYDVTLEDYCACDETCHRNRDVICCDDDHHGVCDKPHDCHQVNVALNKPASMSSYYRKSEASYAVNGITGTTFSAPGYTSDSTQWNCIHTDAGDTSPYWEVDLGKDYTVNSVIIYRRGGGNTYTLICLIIST
ncbi:hypothetical protein V1264_021181 [Littorina saxatilis]|uniref:F5/8 type C domain-containing protein n=1 Tax=Littorina saxatilis TaxID=31220 RepID=A0AAN9GC98_9CAEN